MVQPSATPERSIAQAHNETDPVWWRDPGLRRLNLLLVGVMLGSIGFGYDAALIGGLLANQRWFMDLQLNSASLIGLVIAAQAFGGLVAFAPAAYLCDKLGRRWTIIAGNVGLVAGVIGQTFSTRALDFLGTRVVIGFAGLVVAISSNSMLAELTHPRQRGPATALYNTFFYVGSITSAWTSFGTLQLSSSWTWRLPVLLQVFWSSVQVIWIAFCPESPRWLALRGRFEDAKHVLATYHANGNDKDELVEMEYQEIVTALQADASSKGSRASSWLAMVSNRGNLKRTGLIVFMGLSTQWVGNGIVSFYFAPVLATVGVTSPVQQQGINGGLQIFNWFLAITGALLVDKAGRKKIMLISTCGMLISMVLVTVCSAVYANTHGSGSGIAVIFFLFIFFGFYDIGYTPIPPLYVAEIASTPLRARSVSLYWFCTAAALCFNQFVNPIALAAINWKYYFVYIAVLAAVILILWFLAPETKGLSLEEVAGLFDGDYAREVAHSAEIVHEQHVERRASLASISKDGPSAKTVETV